MMAVAPLLAIAAGASGSDGGMHDVGRLLGVLVAIFVATRLLGELAQRLGQPTVLGEIVAGVLLGASLLGIVDPRDPVIASLAEIGVVVLLFETGLHTSLRSLLSVGSTAATVGLAGVVLPFAGGYGVARLLGVPQLAALVCGAALCATSIGISARVLSDLRCLGSREGRVVLGAAVLDDIVGLVILAVVAEIAVGASVSTFGVARIAGTAVAFVVVAVVVGMWLAPRAFRAAERRIQSHGALGVLGLTFAFAMAALAGALGSALIIGAFAAGIVVHGIAQRPAIEKSTTVIGHFFVPIFFASVGAAVDLRALASGRALAVGGALIVVGIAGKVLAGLLPVWFKGQRLLIGVAMIPRGEVGLIFAQMGLLTGALDPALFGALMLMVLVTTLVTPPALGYVVRHQRPEEEGERGPEDLPGEGGIDDLVAGTSAPQGSRPTPRNTVAIRPK